MDGRIVDRLIGIVAGVLGVVLFAAAIDHLRAPVTARSAQSLALEAAPGIGTPRARPEVVVRSTRTAIASRGPNAVPGRVRAMRRPVMRGPEAIASARLPDRIADRMRTLGSAQKDVLPAHGGRLLLASSPRAVAASHRDSRPNRSPRSSTPVRVPRTVENPNATPEPPLMYDPNPSVVSSTVDADAQPAAAMATEPPPAIVTPQRRP